jgi:hypothetical protein
VAEAGLRVGSRCREAEAPPLAVSKGDTPNNKAGAVHHRDTRRRGSSTGEARRQVGNNITGPLLSSTDPLPGNKGSSSSAEARHQVGNNSTGPLLSSTVPLPGNKGSSSSAEAPRLVVRAASTAYRNNTAADRLPAGSSSSAEARDSLRRSSRTGPSRTCVSAAKFRLKGRGGKGARLLLRECRQSVRGSGALRYMLRSFTHSLRAFINVPDSSSI